VSNIVHLIPRLRGTHVHTGTRFIGEGVLAHVRRWIQPRSRSVPRAASMQMTRIEPKDWISRRLSPDVDPADFQHPHSEIVGMLPEGNWITRAPTHAPQAVLIAKVQDEGRARNVSVQRRETLGIEREADAGAKFLPGRRNTPVFKLSDADLGGLGSIAGWSWGGHHEPDSDLPLLLRSVCAAMVRILQGREFSSAQGSRSCWHWRVAPPSSRRLAQDALNRWWWPSIMMFGPSDGESARRQFHAVENQTLHHDELRQKFIDITAPQAKSWASGFRIRRSPGRVDATFRFWAHRLE